MKVPTRRWGNSIDGISPTLRYRASMKVPTRRWGNQNFTGRGVVGAKSLNESPHPKVGKFRDGHGREDLASASMKVPTRRWGNAAFGESSLQNIEPQ